MKRHSRFSALFEVPEADLRLDEACALIAGHLDPSVDPDEELARLDEIAAGTAVDGVAELCQHMFHTLGFTGDHDGYGSPENSLLNSVLDRRMGIPITLSVVVMAIGSRVGVPLVGVGMPGHFLLRDALEPECFVDAFAGVQLDSAACRRIFHQLHGDQVPFARAYLDPTPNWAIIRRMLANLRNSYGRLEDGPSLAEVMAMRTALPDAVADDFEELALALERIGRFDSAAVALDQAAERTDRSDVGGLSRRALHLRARLN